MLLPINPSQIVVEIDMSLQVRENGVHIVCLTCKGHRPKIECATLTRKWRVTPFLSS